MNAQERAIQSSFREVLGLALGDGALHFAITNESNAPITKGALYALLAQGMRPGVADYLIAWEAVPGLHKLLFIEFKKPGGRQTDKQVEFETDCRAFSIPYAVCHSVDEAMAFIEARGAPLRRVWRDGNLIHP